MVPRKNISNGSVGIQADRDVNISVGLAVREVRELVNLFLEQNFPRLRQDAMEAAQANTENFLSEFQNTLAKNATHLEISSFRDPDVQYSLNEAAIGAAKRGEHANLETLVELLIERVSKKNDDLSNLVYSEAIRIVPRLTRSQINYLTFLYYGKFEIMRSKYISESENLAENFLAFVKNLREMKHDDIQYLEMNNLLKNNHIVLDYYKYLQIFHPVFKEYELDDIEDEIRNRTKHLWRLICEFRKRGIGAIEIHLLGRVIGEIGIRKCVIFK